MKAFALILTVFVLRGRADTLEWDANAASDNVTNYIVHWGAGGTNFVDYTNAVSVGTNLTFRLTNFAAGLYQFAVTAQANGGLESGYSDSLQWTNKPAAPKQLRLKFSLRSKGALDAPWDQELRFTEITLPDDRARFFQTELSMEWVK